MTRSLSRNVFIDASPDIVWRALTDAGELARWFPCEASVVPGVGGSFSLSWGAGFEGVAPITAWEPKHWLQWQDRQNAGVLTVDWRLEARAGCTAVKIVESGFGEGSEWDDEFDLSGGNWSYFLQHLKWYLENHQGVSRQITTWRDGVPFDRDEAFSRLVGPTGLADDAIGSLSAGDLYETTTALGESITGLVVSRSERSRQIGLTINELDKAILLVEVEPDPVGARAGFWLSTYGLGAKALADLRKRYGQMYRKALGASVS